MSDHTTEVEGQDTSLEDLFSDSDEAGSIQDLLDKLFGKSVSDEGEARYQAAAAQANDVMDVLLERIESGDESTITATLDLKGARNVVAGLGRLANAVATDEDLNEVLDTAEYFFSLLR